MNGSEKVLIAQERMANNQVYVFRKAQPSKYSFQCECRSVSESGTRNVSSMSIKMLARSGGKGGQVPAPALPALPCLLSEAMLPVDAGLCEAPLKAGLVPCSSDSWMKNAGSLRSFAFFHVLYSRVQSYAWSLELFGQRHTVISGMCCMQAVRATLPYIRSDVPILIIFRALGLTADKDILQHVVYDFGDTAMMEALRPSLEEAFPIQSQEVTLLLAPHQGHQGRPPLVYQCFLCPLSQSENVKCQKCSFHTTWTPSQPACCQLLKQCQCYPVLSARHVCAASFRP